MAKCPGCGTENPEGYSFCAKCGAIVSGQLNLTDSALSGPMTTISGAAAERGPTDKIVSPMLLVLVLAVVAAMVVVFVWIFVSMLDDIDAGADPDPGTVVQMLAVGLASGIVYYGLLGFVAFELVDRQNRHFARERRLREGVLELIRAAAGTREREALLAGDLQSLRMVHDTPEETHNPWFWTLVVVFPLVVIGVALSALGFMMTADPIDSFDVFISIMVPIALLSIVFSILTYYMFYFLGKNMYEHDRRWNQFVYGSRRALTRLGLPPGRPYRVHALPERSFVVYLIVSLFVSVFVYYWWYALIKDPNEHFRYQWEYEDHLLDMLRQVRPTTSPSASPP